MKLLNRSKRCLYGQAVGLNAYAHHLTSGSVKNDHIAVNYGGARSGNRGGPQVKVELLRSLFPESAANFNLLYLLSGSLYMPPWAIVKLKDRGVPVVLNQNGVFYPAWYPDEWQHENERMAKALSLSDHVFYQSEFCKKSADKFLNSTPKSYEILYNGVDTEFFKPVTRELNKRFRFLVSGNIGPSTYYRLENAVDALALARQQGLDIEIIFAGMVPEALESQLRAYIENKGLNEFFILSGAYKRSDAPKIFARADAYLITKHNDPCPNVVLEAMACGLPILYSASGGIPEQVGHDAGVGLTVPETYEDNPVPTPDAITTGMSQIMANRDVMSTAARKRAVEMFDIKLWADRHRVIFQKLLGQV